jgi:hypothetical protein
VRVSSAPQLADTWFAHAPHLTHLALVDCGAVVGGAALAARLPALTHLAATCCSAFTGGWLGTASGGGAPARLESLVMRQCPSLVLHDVLAPGRHPCLRRACFEDCASPLTDELLGRLPALRQLTARRCTGFVGGPGLGAALPGLEELTVEGCANFTGDGLGGLPALQSLALIECPRAGPAALAGASAGCPALTSVFYCIGARSSGGGSGVGGGEDLPPPLPATLAVLGSECDVAAAVNAWQLQHTWYSEPAWTATRARRGPTAAAAAGGGDAGGSDDDEEEEGRGARAASPKRPRVGGE